MVTYTTTYNLKKPTVADDEDVWGGYLNDSMDLIDDVLDGTTPVTGIDINSGTIDNAVIGGTTPVAGTFTTLTANTSLGVTGNITVSGTVDGRDVAADGTKLDGIESGATADQTKADIDALGIAASTAATLATARNIALSGDVSGSASFNGSANISITATVADDSHNHVISNIDGLQTALDGKQAAGNYFTDGDSVLNMANNDGFSYNDTTNVMYVKLDGTDYQLWHAGNDGSGSGLDADTVDGVHESTFMRKSANSSLSFNGYNINSVEDIYLRDRLFHDGDTDTFFRFGNNYAEIYAGNSQSLYVDANGAYVTDGSLREEYDALSGTSPTCNVNSGGAFSLTMSGNTTFTFTSASSGYSTGFVLQLTGNGSTVTWPSSVKWAGGTAPDAPASGETDIYVFWTRDGGSNWYGVLSSDAAA